MAELSSCDRDHNGPRSLKYLDCLFTETVCWPLDREEEEAHDWDREAPEFQSQKSRSQQRRLWGGASSEIGKAKSFEAKNEEVICYDVCCWEG